MQGADKSFILHTAQSVLSDAVLMVIFATHVHRTFHCLHISQLARKTRVSAWKYIGDTGFLIIFTKLQIIHILNYSQSYKVERKS